MRVVRVLVVLLLMVALGGAPPARAEVPPDGARLPDVIEEIPSHLQIQNDHQREWLRFTTVHLNIGEGNLQIRGGGQVASCEIDGISYDQCTHATQEILNADGDVVASRPAGVALFHPEHNHWHQSAVATFELRETLAGPALSGGVKITFCFVDVEFIGGTGAAKKDHPRTYFECNGDLQGLASQWGDSYHQSTPLQELEITGIPDGDYYLTHEADPDDHWLESDETNNFSWVRLRITRKGANPKVMVLDHSECEVPAQCGSRGNP